MTCTHRKVVDYDIIESRTQDTLDYFKKIVKKYIKEGYEPIGGLKVNTDCFVQTMIKYSECPQHPELDEEEQEIEDNFEFMGLQKYYYKCTDLDGLVYLIPKTLKIEAIQAKFKGDGYIIFYKNINDKNDCLLVNDLGNLKHFYEENCK